MHYERFRRYGTTDLTTRMHDPLDVRVWSRIDRSGGPDACWLWTGAKNNRGYGQITNQQRRIYGHRLVWSFVNGPIPESLQILHSCDNPPCCNPAHLSIGTQADNMQDCSAKGRTAMPTNQPHGTAHWNRKLTDDDVRQARASFSAGHSAKVIAARLGVSPTTVFDAIARRTWKHLP